MRQIGREFLGRRLSDSGQAKAVASLQRIISGAPFGRAGGKIHYIAKGDAVACSGTAVVRFRGCAWRKQRQLPVLNVSSVVKDLSSSQGLSLEHLKRSSNKRNHQLLEPNSMLAQIGLAVNSHG